MNNHESIEERILECLSRNYRLRGALSRLSGENLNYLLRRDGDEPVVIKIVDEHMPPDVVRMENEAVKHASSAGLPFDLPKTIQNMDGNLETGINIRKKGLERLRVITFVNGMEIKKLPDISIEMLKNVGKMIAKLAVAMESFDHPAAHRSHRWNLLQADRHRDKIEGIADRDKLALIRWAFDRREGVKAQLEYLPCQFIHGDLNPENILVSRGRVSGVVDFGDSCMNPAVCDLAIALTYFMMDRDEPLAAADPMVSAYHRIRPLEDQERSLLLPLVCGRLATSIAIAESRRLIDPGNPNWFSEQGSAWRLLKQLEANQAG